jgi:hypothetical protein
MSMAQVRANSAWSTSRTSSLNSDEANRNVEVRQPKRGLGQAFEMLQVLCDVLAAANAPEAWNQSDGGIGFDHSRSLF